jgi:hypothetical protein
MKMKGRLPDSGWYYVMRVYGPDPKILPATRRHVQGHAAAVKLKDDRNEMLSQEERSRGDRWEIRNAPPGD